MGNGKSEMGKHCHFAHLPFAISHQAGFFSGLFAGGPTLIVRFCPAPEQIAERSGDQESYAAVLAMGSLLKD
jgi:hypothetical protein